MQLPINGLKTRRRAFNVLCPKQYVIKVRVSFVLNWVRFQILSGSLISKYCSSNPPLPLGAETDTILKTKKPLGRGDQRPLEQERSRDCDKSRTESEAYFAC